MNEPTPGIPAFVRIESPVSVEGPTDDDVEEQADWNRYAVIGRAVKLVDLDPHKLRESLDELTRLFDIVLQNQRDKSTHGFQLEAFSVGLSVNVQGKLAVVEAGAEASIELSFRRATSPAGEVH